MDLKYEASRSLKRIIPKVYSKIETSTDSAEEADLMRETIDRRLDEYWLTLFDFLYQLYGHNYDFYYYLENITLTTVDCWISRPEKLKQLDIRRENDPEWFLSERMIGGSLYVDLFAGDLPNLKARIPYLKELGLTYLHLMPLFATRAGNSDGGYAISDYRTVDPKLGTISDLQDLADELRANGISLVLDFVFNHTSDDHEWAIRAQEGEREYADYYHIYPDREIPDQYEQHLREIFPTIRRGSFTFNELICKWVWTTFNNFQWDLKYSNPEVFRAMAGEMLFLANTGVEILRLDAVAFIWKQMGTNCENLPEAHLIIQAFNAICRIAAPSLIFKSEAIVHPDEVVRYIGKKECQLSYNPTLMALLWESLATRKTALLQQSLNHRQTLPFGTAWINYLRGHDDIGWSFDDADARAVGIDPNGHRDFLNRFYTARFPGSFAAGIPFQHNESTGDMRICGTMASLAGLEKALQSKNQQLLQMAIARIKMIYGILCSVSGMPLIFAGEEMAVLNDYNYELDPDKMDDSRWVHRPSLDLKLIGNIQKDKSARGKLFSELRRLFQLRKSLPALAGNHFQLLRHEGAHTLAFLRRNDNSQLVVVANFSEDTQLIDLCHIKSHGISHFLKNSFDETVLSTSEKWNLKPYDLLWLEEY